MRRSRSGDLGCFRMFQFSVVRVGEWDCCLELNMVIFLHVLFYTVRDACRECLGPACPL